MRAVIAVVVLLLAANAAAAGREDSSTRLGPRRTRPLGKNPPGGTLAQLSETGKRPAPPAAAPSGTGGESGDGTEQDEVFDSLDANHDGLLDRAEFKTIEDKLGTDTAKGVMALVGSSQSFWGAFANSLIMIIVTELGDKTFFLAALMAMRHPRTAVFVAAIGALAVMHVLSVAIGFALPSLLPRFYTHYAATAMFLFFGVQLLWDSRKASSDAKEGLEEAEEELVSKDKKADDASGLDAEAGSGTLKQRAFGQRSADGNGASTPAGRGAAAVAAASPLAVMVTVFTMTFVAEWGDRSQIATIAMGAAKDPFGVCVGGVLGHALCTGLAVLGGKLLATKISEKAVLIVGGLLFLAFGVHSVWVGPGE